MLTMAKMSIVPIRSLRHLAGTLTASNKNHYVMVKYFFIFVKKMI